MSQLSVSLDSNIFCLRNPKIKDHDIAMLPITFDSTRWPSVVDCFRFRCAMRDNENALYYLHNIGIVHRDVKPLLARFITCECCACSCNWELRMIPSLKCIITGIQTPGDKFVYREKVEDDTEVDDQKEQEFTSIQYYTEDYRCSISQGLERWKGLDGDEFQLITGWGPKISSAASLWDAWSTNVEAARELRLTMVSGVRIPPRPFFRWRSYVNMEVKGNIKFISKGEDDNYVFYWYTKKMQGLLEESLSRRAFFADGIELRILNHDATSSCCSEVRVNHRRSVRF
ncbi:hypothetical protein E3N88_18734 [Mikania micrantha]|uniref:Protein kinase domain-containing protein n=1 Tax=Mikania micrantha TaxID=192012 RepID=A0A5N6NNZ0_9ASTR|nr:hypothetical protein E3N88_18734 [Mikania micrantha]